MAMSTQTTVIRPKKTISLQDFKEIWSHRELLYFFTWRDFKLRYKQTFIGVAWALFQPIVSMIVFSLFFGKLAGVPSDNVPYPIFVFIGLLFWQFFSDALTNTSNSLTNNQSIVTKVYFPRIILPISTVVTKLGSGLFLASINVKYRDVRYILPYFIQLFMFITPVIYSASIAGKYSWILAFNPMSGVIQTARAAFLHTAPINWLLVSISIIASIFILVVGTIVFKKTERYFADII